MMKAEGKELTDFALLFTAGCAAAIFLSGWQAGFLTGQDRMYMLAGISFFMALASAAVPALTMTHRTSEACVRNAVLVNAAFFFCGLYSSAVHVITSPSADMTGIHRAVTEAASQTAGSLKSLIGSIPFSDKECNAMISALFTGDRSGLSRQTTESFRISGAAHILALSGMHLAVIYSIMARIFTVTGSSRAAVLTRAAVTVGISGFYTMMTGAGESIVRAFLFITLNEAARCTGRTSPPMNIFCAALIIQAAADPSVLTSAGFQLSYLAMAGIYLIYPRMLGWYRSGEDKDNEKEGTPRKIRIRPMRALWKIASMAIACQITTAPAVWYHFGTFPVYFLITNLISIPLSTLVIYLSLAVLILQAAGICPMFLIKADEALINAMRYALDTISGL